MLMGVNGGLRSPSDAGFSVSAACLSLTERSFHVIGRTCLGIPDQLSFRSSSVKHKNNTTWCVLDSQPRLLTPRVLTVSTYYSILSHETGKQLL